MANTVREFVVECFRGFYERLPLKKIAVDGSALTPDASGVINIPAGGNSKTFYGVCDTSAATVDKVVVCDNFTADDLKEGVIMSTKFIYANTGTVGSLTLAVNDTSAYPIKKIYGTTSSNAGVKNLSQAGELSAGSIIPFVFTGSYWLVTGVDINVNSTYTINYSLDAGQYTAGSGSYAVTRYSLLMEKPDGTWEKITKTSANYSTAASKTVNSNGFLLDRIVYYNTTAGKANGALLATNVCYHKAASVDMRYSTNCGSSPGWAVGDYVYLVGTLNANDGLFYLDSTAWWTNTLPNTDDGKLYIRLGLVLADTDGDPTYNISFHDDRLIFYHDGVSVKVYQGNSGGSSDFMTNITYADLKDLHDTSSLIPGMQYRIIDYHCTTTQEFTGSADNQFDIIVTADSSTVLNENARATWHDGDTYFEKCKLNKWELKYCLDNDTSTYAWADTSNGKGVVYYMKDEWNNECPYDFKNIQFQRWAVTACPDCPSLEANSPDNELGYYYGAKWLRGVNALDNATYGEDNDYFYTFALKDLEQEKWFDYTVVAHLGLKDIDEVEVVCSDNHLAEVTGEYGFVNGEMVKVLNNIVFFNSYINTLDFKAFSHCNKNRLLGCCHSNTFGNDCYSNLFGNFCLRNTFGINCYGNTFGNGCSSNTFGNNCYSNTFRNNCYSNTFGDSCYSNSFGNSCESNSFGHDCDSNTFGDSCCYIKFGDSLSPRSYYQYIIVENGNQNICLDTSQTTSSIKKIRNIKIAQGVNNTNVYKTIIHDTLNDTFQTIYQPTNSQTISV